MGLIAKVLSYLKATVRDTTVPKIKTLVTGKDTKILEMYSDSGNDSPPLPGDYVLAVKVSQTGIYAAAGNIDGSNIPIAEPGEKRLYGRDETGSIKATVYLKKTGEIVINNGSGSFSMDASGNINLNGVVITPTGNITTSGSISGVLVTDSSTNVTLSTHVHPSTGAPPTPGT